MTSQMVVAKDELTGAERAVTRKGLKAQKLMHIHTAHAQKHFSPETRSKERPKQSSPQSAWHALAL